MGRCIVGHRIVNRRIVGRRIAQVLARFIQVGHRGLQPRPCQVGHRSVQGDQMGGRGKHLHLGVRYPGDQVGQEPMVKHRVAPAPCKQHRAGHRVQVTGHLLQGHPRRVGGTHRDVGYELGHGVTTGPSPVGSAQGVTVLAIGHAGGAAHERRGALASKGGCRAGQSDERRHAHAIGQANGSVGEHQRPAVQLGGGPDGDRATPVVGGHGHRAWCVPVAKRHQFADALGQDARRSPAREPHAGLVHRHHPPARWRLGEQVAPDV